MRYAVRFDLAMVYLFNFAPCIKMCDDKPCLGFAICI